MGTWGTGLFDSDTAEDYLDSLARQSVAQRLEVVERTFRVAAEEAGGRVSVSVLPEEVVAAAAVVAANVPGGRFVAQPEDHPDVAEWLAKPVTPGLAASAVQALEVALPADGWFWQSWVSAEDRAQARAEIDSVVRVLRLVVEPESS